MVLGLRLFCGFDPMRQWRADIRARVNHSNPSRVLPSTQTIKPAPRSAVLLNPQSAIYGDTLNTTAPRTGIRDANPRGFDRQRHGVAWRERTNSPKPGESFCPDRPASAGPSLFHVERCRTFLVRAHTSDPSVPHGTNRGLIVPGSLTLHRIAAMRSVNSITLFLGAGYGTRCRWSPKETISWHWNFFGLLEGRLCSSIRSSMMSL